MSESYSESPSESASESASYSPSASESESESASPSGEEILFKWNPREIHARVDVTWTDPFVNSGMVVSTTDENYTSWHDPHLVDTIISTPHKYLILDGTCSTDGTYYAAPFTNVEQQNNQFGWYSESVANGSGVFSTPPDVTVTFAEVRPIKQLKIVGEPTLGQYPTDFDI